MGDIVNIRYLYLNGFVEHSDDFYLALKLLIENTPLRNLLDEPDIDVISPESELLVMATLRLDYQTVVELLRNERTDPGVYDNAAIIAAVRLRHAPIVEALLSHKKVDPSARENTALRLAAINGDCYIAELLLRNSKVNPADADNDAFILAVTNNRYDMVRLLLSDKRVDIRARDYEAVKIAKKLGFALVLQLLCYRLSY
jgi:ankyrin repeat protein